MLRRAKEDGEHEAAEKESPSKIPEIEEQVAGLNVGDEVEAKSGHGPGQTKSQ